MLMSREVSDHAEFLALGIESSLEPMVIAKARRDANGRIHDFTYVEVSESACDFFGRGRDELLSTSVRGVWPARVADELVSWLSELVETQSKAVRHNVTVETPRVETTGRFSISAVSSGDYVGFSYDGSAEIRELSANYRLLLENSSDIILRTDADGRIEWIFDTVARVLGYEATQLVGQRLADLTHPDDAARRVEIRQELESQGTARFRLRLRGVDDVFHHFGVLAHLQPSSTGHDQGIIAGLHLIDHEVAAEEAATVADERYRLMAEYGSDVIALERRGVIEWVSPFVEKLLGISSAVVIGRSLADLVHPDDRSSLQSFTRDATLSQPASLTLRMLMPDATYRWVTMRSREVVDAGSSTRVRVTSWRDAHDDVTGQRALMASESRFRMLAESVTDVVVECDITGEVHWVSPSAQLILGWRPEELLGRALVEFVYPDDVERSMLHELVMSGGGDGVASASGTLEVRYVTSTGNVRWMLQRSRRVRGLSGEGDTLVVGLHDIDDTVRQRQRFEETKSRFEMLTENMTDVVYRVNLEGELVWVSPSATTQLGWLAGDLIGHSVLDLIFVEDHARVLAWRRLLHLGENLEELTIRVRQSSGDFVWMKVRAAPTRAETGRVNGVVVSLRDCETEVVTARALRTISAGSRVLMRVGSPQDLLDQMCQVAVLEGGYLLAWYGKKLHDAQSSLRVVASSVGHESYLEGIEVHWGDDVLGAGPAGRAIRSGQICTVTDIDTDPSFAPWSRSAREHGFRSAAAVPVVVEGRVDGSWQVYAMEPRAFTSDVLNVLEDLALEIGFGLSRLGALD